MLKRLSSQEASELDQMLGEVTGAAPTARRLYEFLEALEERARKGQPVPHLHLVSALGMARHLVRKLEGGHG